MTVRHPPVDHVDDKHGTRWPVRRLTPDDRELLQDFARELSPEATRMFLPHPYDDVTLKALLRRSVQGQDLVMGLFDEERIVGYFFLWYFRSRVPLLGIGMLDAIQGRGLGGPMIRLLLDAARAAGCDGVELTTQPNNHRAFSLYRKLGFHYYADVQNMDGNGQLLTERAMFHALKPGAQPMQGPHRPPLPMDME